MDGTHVSGSTAEDVEVAGAAVDVAVYEGTMSRSVKPFPSIKMRRLRSHIGISAKVRSSVWEGLINKALGRWYLMESS